MLKRLGKSGLPFVCSLSGTRLALRGVKHIAVGGESDTARFCPTVAPLTLALSPEGSGDAWGGRGYWVRKGCAGGEGAWPEKPRLIA